MPTSSRRQSMSNSERGAGAPLSLQNKTALVTGAARGIGAAIAMRLARDGAKLVLFDREPPDRTRAAIEACGGNAVAIACDISSIDQLDATFAKLRDQSLSLDILVNNAGLGSSGMPTIATATPEEFDLIFSVNARGTFFVTQKSVAMMRDGGRVVSVASSSSQTTNPGLSMYGGSKAAIDTFTRIWATELAPRRITVNAVLPGIVNTDLIRDNMTEELVSQCIDLVPLGRLGEPEDIADVIAFLCSDDARWITGQGLKVSGGA